MRIVMLSDVYFPRVNGVSTSIETFRRCLAALGAHVQLVAPAYDDAPAGSAADIIRLPSRRIPFDPEDRLMSWRAALALTPELARDKPDLIHIQTPFVAHHAGVALARRLRIPAVATYHTLFEEYLHHYIPFLPRTWLQGLARHHSRRQCEALEGVVVPSVAMAERLRQYGVQAPLEILPTGIPTAHFAQGDRARFRAQHGLAPARPVALYVGRVAHEKNIGFLLHALQHARQRLPELCLVITGEGPARPDLERQVRTLGLCDNVRFLGYLDRRQALPDAYAGADLFVFASRTETQGLVLLEAMAAGLPVLALAVMGTRDILAPERGCRIGPEEPGAFGAAMAELLATPERLQSLARAAQEYATCWSDSAMAERLLAFYTRIQSAWLSPR